MTPTGLIILSTALTAVVSAQRWHQPDHDNGYEYLYVASPRRNRNNAQTECYRTGGYGANLATIADEETNDFLFSLSPSTRAKRWIGLRRTGSGCQTEWDTWAWDDGTPYDAGNTFFFEGEPSNYNCNEKCVMQGTSNRDAQPPSSGYWNDARCGSKAEYICQRPLPIRVHQTQTMAFEASCGAGTTPSSLHTLLLNNWQLRINCGINFGENEAINVVRGDGENIFVVDVASREPSADAVVYTGITETMKTCTEKIIDAAQGTCSLSRLPLTTAQTCSDGIRNGNENGVDCGGACEEKPDCVNRGDVGNSFGDPHFVVNLPSTGNLCFDVHGTPGEYLNLVNTKHLVVNTLVIKAPASVQGTYHGAIGIIAQKSDQFKQDQLVILADGTIQFNGRTMMARSTTNSTAILSGDSISVVITPVAVQVLNSEQSIAFTVKFVQEQHDRVHLDFGIDKYPNDPSGDTHGIIGQFLSARSSIQRVDSKTSLLSINGKSVEVVQRALPQVNANVKGQCYKYFDAQADGLLDGHVTDYVLRGMFEAPTNFNNFRFNISRHVTRIDRYVTEIARRERASISTVDSIARNLLTQLNVTVDAKATSDDIRNAVIAATSKRAAMAVDSLQSMSTSKVLQILEAAI